MSLRMPCTLLPRHADQGVDVVAHHRRLGGHGRHQLQLVQLGQSPFPLPLRASRVFDALLPEILEFVGRILELAELFLDRLHLLVEVVLALTSSPSAA
jgi:hypothetical protein